MVRKFHAPTTREALRMVRDALGANAIILSNRQVAGGVEIMAVSDEDMEALSSQAEPVAARRPPLRPTPSQAPAITPLTEYLAQREASIIRPVRSPRPETKPAPEPAPSSAPANEAAPAAADQSAAATEALAREIRALRSLVEGQLAAFAWGELAGRQPTRAEAMKRLLAAGFSSGLAKQLIHGLPREINLQQAMKWLKTYIAHNLPTPAAGEDLLERGGVYALVGPTGVGKTTTVAKLAARAVLRQGATRVALITTDTYRIGAQDQLRIYGRILGTPVFAVQDENDLELALADLSRKHLVLIDTVGMSQRDRRVAEQIALLRGESRGVNRLLLLGAPSQGMTLEEVVRAYSGPGLIGCILTKIDEALSFGPCLDVVIRHQLKVYYVTNGQRVPEDLHAANALYLADRAFRLAQAESPYTPAEDDYPVLMAALERNALPEETSGPGVAGALR